VTPLDALMVIRSIRQARTAESGELSTLRSSFYGDVNGDGEITPLDALLVINHISRASRSAGTIDVIQPSSLAPSAVERTAVLSDTAIDELLSTRNAADPYVLADNRWAAPLKADDASGDDDQDDAWLRLLADDVAPLWN
jgi:fibronectin-binding autotransporter adhesin